MLREGALDAEEGWIYLFLLLATALNMRDNRKHAGLDGAELFELLSAEVALRYLGGRQDSRARKHVFGTSRCNWPEGDDTDLDDLNEFGSSINELCKLIGEGGAYRPKTKKRVHARDDKLDVVVWREFSDKRASKLMGFGQCKTGTHWSHELPRLNPRSFCDRWLDTPLASPPIKMFFLTDRIAGDLSVWGIDPPFPMGLRPFNRLLTRSQRVVSCNRSGLLPWAASKVSLSCPAEFKV
jgi:hypothetical protein